MAGLLMAWEGTASWNAILAQMAVQATPAYLMLRAASIYGGTNEIQKNIINKAVLGL